MAAPCQILVMASGNGSNFQALCDGVADGRIANAALCRLVVNRAKAFATTRAERHGIPWEYVNLVAHGFQARADYDAALAARVLSCAPQPRLIVLAGWMHVLGEAFLKPVAAAGIRVINLHPALPGRYDGARAIERAWDDFCAGRLEGNTTGVMVHHVVAEVDRGEPIATRKVACRPDDDLASLTTRINAHENELLVEATAKMVAEIVAAQ